jgi:hypothetical protein
MTVGSLLRLMIVGVPIISSHHRSWSPDRDHTAKLHFYFYFFGTFLHYCIIVTSSNISESSQTSQDMIAPLPPPPWAMRYYCTINTTGIISAFCIASISWSIHAAAPQERITHQLRTPLLSTRKTTMITFHRSISHSSQRHQGTSTAMAVNHRPDDKWVAIDIWACYYCFAMYCPIDDKSQ